MRNELKCKIKNTKREFYQKALSSSKPKEIWQVIHRILHPSPQPLRAEPEELNSFFASTAERVAGTSAIPTDELWKLIDSLPEDEGNSFHLRKFTCKEVLSELKKLRNDCSCGPDSIPVKFLKMAAEQLTRSLTHILNNCIDNLTFPSVWKTARISTIPKVKEIKSNSDLRSISILPFLSKVYERLVLRQMVNFLSFGPFGILKESLGAYGKGHSTTTVLLAMRDNILHSVKRGEATMAILADFSKAFDTVAYETVLKKM